MSCNRWREDRSYNSPFTVLDQISKNKYNFGLDDLKKGYKVPSQSIYCYHHGWKWSMDKTIWTASAIWSWNRVKSVREITELVQNSAFSFLYAFSTENWNRPGRIIGLMSLLVDTMGLELNTLQKNNIKLKPLVILVSFPDTTRLHCGSHQTDQCKYRNEFNTGFKLQRSVGKLPSLSTNRRRNPKRTTRKSLLMKTTLGII